MNVIIILSSLIVAISLLTIVFLVLWVTKKTNLSCPICPPKQM